MAISIDKAGLSVISGVKANTIAVDKAGLSVISGVRSNSIAIDKAGLSVAGRPYNNDDLKQLPGYGKPHRYWRIYIEQNSGDGSYTTAGEIEFRATKGGPDLTNPTDAANGAAIASSDSGVGNEAAQAFDDRESAEAATNDTYWSTAANEEQPCWIGYDFSDGNAVDVNEVYFYPAREANRQPKEWQLEYSDDGTTWYPKVILPTKTDWVLGRPFKFDTHTEGGETPTGYRYWRWRITDVSDDGGFNCIAELELLDNEGNDLTDTTGGTPSASSVFNSNGPANAFADDGKTTQWYTDSNAEPNGEWVQWDFGEGNQQLPLQWSILTANTTAYAPRGIVLEASNDASSWKTMSAYQTEDGINPVSGTFDVTEPQPKPVSTARRRSVSVGFF